MQDAAYIIFAEGMTIKSLNAKTGSVDCSGTDAATVIQSAIDGLAKTGGRIFIKNGSYKIRSEISVSNMSVSIEGQTLGYYSRHGMWGHYSKSTYYGTWLFADGKDGSPIFSLTGNRFFASLSNLVLEGKSEKCPLVLVNGFNDITINHCFLYRYTNAIDVVGSSHILRIHDNWIERGTKGLSVISGSHDLMLVSRNYFLGSKESKECPSSAGIWIAGSLASLIELIVADNVFRNNYHAIRIEKGSDITINGNIIYDGVYGVRLLGVSNIPVVANTFRSLTTGVSEENGAGNNVVVGNTFSAVANPVHRLAPNSRYANNVGYSAAAPAAITVAVSPFAYQNADGYPEDVIVSGGMVSDIAWSRDGSAYYTTGLKAGKFHLEPLEYLKVTYSSAPKMTKAPF